MRIATNFLMALFGILVGFLGIEIVLRISGPDNAQEFSPLYQLSTKDFTYELRPNIDAYHQRISTNPLGMRSDEMLLPEKSGPRVLVLGDSVTFGGDDAYGDLYTAKLEELLNAGETVREPVKVLNAGVPGYSPFNSLSWFRTYGKNLHADIVVIQVCLNDIVDPWLHLRAVFGPQLSRDLIPSGAIPDSSRRGWATARTVLRKSEVYAEIENALRYSLPPLRYVSLDDDVSLKTYSDPSAPAMKWLETTLGQLISEIRAASGRPVLLVPPLSYQLSPGYAELDAQKFFRDFGIRSDLPVVDSLDALKPLGPDGAFRLLKGGGYYDIWHLTKRGHEVVARGLVEQIKKLLDSPET